MQVSQIVKKAYESHIEKFRSNPEGMAASYICLALAWGISYAGLIIAIKELDKKENQLIDVIISYEKQQSYLTGLSDAYNSFEKTNNNRKDHRKH